MVAIARRALLAAAVALAAAACDPALDYVAGPEQAPAPEAAERPTFTVGDEFWFGVGDSAILVEVFEGEEDGLLAFRVAMEQTTRYYTPDLALVRVERAFEGDRSFHPDDGRLEFPLAVGKTWTRDFRVLDTGSLGSEQLTRACEVLDTGEATVPAGRFRVYRIACSLRALGSAEPAREEVLYAPAVGRIIARYRRHEGPGLRLLKFVRAP